MSAKEESEAYWPHPLMPWIESCAIRAVPLVPYAPQEEFKRNLDYAGWIHPLLAEPEAKRHFLATYQRSMALVFALAAGGGALLNGQELHCLVYHAAEGDPLAFALCESAAFALEWGRHPSFTVATRLPGFMEALEAWARHFEFGKPFSGKDQFIYINRSLVQKEVQGADFWLKACMNDFSPKEFMRASSDELEKFDDAERQRKNREAKRKLDNRKPKPTSRFKDKILGGWLPLSLWARDHDGIAHLLEPNAEKSDETLQRKDRVKRDISDLGFSDSHHPELHKFIDQAEKGLGKYSNDFES